MTKRTSKVALENKEFFEALYKGEWADASEFDRGAVWRKMKFTVTDEQSFTGEFLNGYQEEERSEKMEPETEKSVDRTEGEL